ncbi:MAG: (2Fe-2S) ferredoxin domain-containing protein [Elainellaceae cyanobacterium]
MKDSQPSASLISYPVSSPAVAYQSSREIRILHGQYMEGVSSSKGRLKWIKVKHNEAEVRIKIPKPIGYSLTGKLQPGAMIQVWVRSQKDYLKALMVMPSLMPASAETDLIEPCDLEPSDADSTHQAAAVQIPQPITAQQPSVCTLRVCTKGKCYKKGGRQVMQALETEIREQQLEGAIAIEATGCLKNCKKGPTVKASPGSAQYSFVRPQDVSRMLQRHAI